MAAQAGGEGAWRSQSTELIAARSTSVREGSWLEDGGKLVMSEVPPPAPALLLLSCAANTRNTPYRHLRSQH